MGPCICISRTLVKASCGNGVCDPIASTVKWEVEILESLEAHGPARLVKKPRDPVLKKVNIEERHLRLSSDFHVPDVLTCTHTQTYAKMNWP